MTAGSPLPVLLYHSVDTSCSPAFAPWMVTPEVLSAQLEALSGAGFTPVSIDRVLAAREGSASLPSRPYAVTFDDAFADFAQALPILQAFDVPATLFVPTAYLGGTSRWLQGEERRPILTAEEVAALPAAGVSVGAHGHTHAMLDLLGSTSLLHELSESRRLLSDIVNEPVRAVAYPHGYNGRRVRRHAAVAGYSYGLSVEHRLNEAADDRYALARVIVYGGTTPDELLCQLQGKKFDRRIPSSCAPAAAWVWRMIRQATSGRQQRRLSAHN
jgi:peptidoglycan/xylan/chitin deacetylase (PgdA/CDA1 family)